MKSVWGYCVASLLAVAWMCPAAIAEVTAEKPTPKVGDKWEFRQSVKAAPGGETSEPWSRSVTEVLPDRITLVGGNGQSIPFDASLNYIDPKGKEYSVMTYKFPMSVGNEWKYTARAGPTGVLERSGSYKVMAFESVTVPAGTFDCFRVEGEWQTNGAGYNARGSETYWYCPKISYIAKRSGELTVAQRTYTNYGKTSETRLSELTRFTAGQ